MAGKFKGVVFDLDGVLMDSEPVNVKAAEMAFAKYGKTLSREDVDFITGRAHLTFVPVLVEKFGLPKEEEKPLIDACYEHYMEMWPSHVTVMPLALEVLKALKAQGKVLGLATSNNSAIVKRFVEKCGLEGVFDFTLTRDDVSRRKPDPEIYLKSLKLTGLASSEVLVVEDTQVGVEAAKAAGLSCAAVPNEHSRGQDFSRSDYLLNSLNEVLTLAK